jgi:secernin
VCDTLCILGDGFTVFAKNSDRPRSEPQIVEALPGRPPGASLRTQYLDIPDAGASATLLSRPTWLWGAEHGVNEHRVAIGNEAIFTSDDASKAPSALIGMDLVRLGLERGRDALGALDVLTELLGTEGQGGVCDTDGLAYWSSFMIADTTSAWILETTGRTWAARPVVSGAAISNRLTLGRDWTRASPDVPPGTDVDSWSLPGLPTGFADVRLAAGRAFVESADCDPRAVVGALRDHGPGATAPPAPEDVSPEGAGWTLCLHAGKTVTTASMVALLPVDRQQPARAWVALGSPCTSVYVPVPVPTGTGPAPLAALVGDPARWHRFEAVRDAVGTDPGALASVRRVLDGVEDALWDEADGLGSDLLAWADFGTRATAAVEGGLDRLASAGIGSKPGR